MRKVLKILLFIPILYISALPVYLARSSNIKPCREIQPLLKIHLIIILLQKNNY